MIILDILKKFQFVFFIILKRAVRFYMLRRQFGENRRIKVYKSVPIL